MFSVSGYPLNKKRLNADMIRQLAAVFFAEFINPAGSIHNALFARIKWMASGADLDLQVFAQHGTGYKTVAATASYCNLLILRMDIWFHRPSRCRW